MQSATGPATGPATGQGGQTSASGRSYWHAWPHYDAAEVGLRNFWYPVVWSREVSGKPISVTLLGEKVALVRDKGKVFALNDRCPHRGVPLSSGTQEFPGTITCPYHGWTYRLETGQLCAVLTDGPDSPLTGKVTVRTYPVEERLGLVWVFMGEIGAEAPPVEDDIPAELLGTNPVVQGRIEGGRRGNWRYAAENGFDEGHAKFLHRNAVWTGRRRMPAWNDVEVITTADGQWISRRSKNIAWEGDFPGVGHWDNRSWWTRKKPQSLAPADPTIASFEFPGMVSTRVPSIVRVAYPNYVHYEWAIPEDGEHHRYVQLFVGYPEGALRRALFRLKYRLYVRWAFHGQFTGQDAWAVDLMDIPPERLYRPDVSVIEWRRLVEKNHR
jgi:nitrite reductase/ring-hydroxylating ferredoxin subunit